MKSFNEQYGEVVQNCLNGDAALNERTGVVCHTALHQQITVDMSESIPLIGFRRTFPYIAAAEVAWALMGTTDPTWLQRHTHVWDAFINDRGELTSSYGYRWMRAFGVDQLDTLIKKLKKNPSSRQTTLMAWNPTVDSTVDDQPLNVPCPIGYVFNILGGRLSCDVFLRSSDIILGFPVDLVYFCLLNNLIANTLKVKTGQVSFRLSNAHIYDNHFERVVELMATDTLELKLPTVTYDIEDVRLDPDGFVEAVKNISPKHPLTVRFDMVK
jgi:thymidylate synthase